MYAFLQEWDASSLRDFENKFEASVSKTSSHEETSHFELCFDPFEPEQTNSQNFPTTFLDPLEFDAAYENSKQTSMTSIKNDFHNSPYKSAEKITEDKLSSIITQLLEMSPTHTLSKNIELLKQSISKEECFLYNNKIFSKLLLFDLVDDERITCAKTVYPLSGSFLSHQSPPSGVVCKRVVAMLTRKPTTEFGNLSCNDRTVNLFAGRVTHRPKRRPSHAVKFKTEKEEFKIDDNLSDNIHEQNEVDILEENQGRNEEKYVPNMKFSFENRHCEELVKSAVNSSINAEDWNTFNFEENDCRNHITRDIFEYLLQDTTNALNNILTMKNI